MKKVYLTGMIGALLLINSLTLRAATVFVTDLSAMAFQSTIANAASGDTILFDPSLFANGPQTIHLSSTFVIEKDLTLVGPGVDLLRIDGNGNRLFLVKSGSLRLEALKLVNGLAKGWTGGSGSAPGGGGAGLGGGIFINTNASFFGSRLAFQGCSASGGESGSCTFVADGGIIEDINALYGNATGGGGGGFGGHAAGLTGGIGDPLEDGYGGGGNILKSKPGSGTGGSGGFGGGGAGTFQDQSGRGGFGGGSGVFIKIQSKNGGLYYTYNFVENPGGAFGGNSSGSQAGGGASLGGAVFVRDGGALYLDECSFSHNVAVRSLAQTGQSKGGAIFVMENAIAKLRNCTFSENMAPNAIESVGFTYYMQSDTNDVYGVIGDLTDSDVSAFPSVDATPTPISTPIPRLESIRYEFSNATTDENNVILQGAGFGAYPQASVIFGSIPTDNGFEGATDGLGAIVTAQPGEGVMIFGSRIESQDAAVIRCSVRTDRPGAQVTLAAIGGEPDIFVATNSPFNSAYFQGNYRRIGVFVTPPTNGFLPVLQILNTSSTESLTAYVDNLEIVPLKRFHAYHGEFLNCNEVDPSAEAIQKEVSGNEAGILGPWKTVSRRNPASQQTGVSVDNFIRLNFSEKTASANSVSLQGAGFGAYPQASVLFSYIPTDNAYDGATDGQGVMIEAKPGEGVMIFGPSLTTSEAAMIRCNVRTESNDAEIVLATIGAEPDRFITTNTPTHYRYFEGQYRRISTFAAPSSGGFIPVIQVINPHETETLIVYLDNFDIVMLDPANYYYGEFLNGDEIDPANGQIGFPVTNP